MIFSAKVYQSRRKELSKFLDSSSNKLSALVVPSAPLIKMPGGKEIPFRQNSDLLYLSGFEEPKSCLVILFSSQKPKSILFVEEKNKEKELWTGWVHGPELAGEKFQVDECYPSNQFSVLSLKLLKNIDSLFYSFGLNVHWDQQIKNILTNLEKKNRMSVSVHNSTHLIASLRMKKSAEEIERMRKSISASAFGHDEVMKRCAPLVNERELHGIFLSAIMKKGAKEEAYTGIFASGPNACTLHYTKNNQVLQDGELLLVDAGAEYEGYASDITRTFPVKGKFSETQKRMYEKILEVQKQIIQFLKPGVLFDEIQKKTVEWLSELMREEGLLTGSQEQIIETKEYKKYFPHYFGHSLGLDVHDPLPSKTRNFSIEEGFVLTVEPGLYLPKEDSSLKEELRGFAVRIEDDVLITKDGCEVLSEEIPKEMEALEERVGSQKT